MSPLQGCRCRAGLKTPQERPADPSPQTGAQQPQAQSLLGAPASGPERPDAAGLPPADTSVVVTSVAPPPPALAGSSPFGRSRSCHPRVPLGEGWRRPAAVASSGCPRGPLAAGGAALLPAPESPAATSHCCSSQQRKHVTDRAKTLSVIDPGPIRVGSPLAGHPGRCSSYCGGDHYASV